MAFSLLRLAAIQCFERVKDSADLVRKSRFIATEPIKCEVGKVGETQKATRDSTAVASTFIPESESHFYVVNSTELSCIASGRFPPPEHRVNYLIGIRKQLAVLPIVMQLPSLNLEQSGFHSRGAAQPPQNARRSQHELALDSQLRIIVGGDCCLKRFIIFGILKCA